MNAASNAARSADAGHGLPELETIRGAQAISTASTHSTVAAPSSSSAASSSAAAAASSSASADDSNQEVGTSSTMGGLLGTVVRPLADRVAALNNAWRAEILLRNNLAQGKTSGESDGSSRDDKERNYEDEDRGLEMDSDDGRGGGGGDGHTVIAPAAMHMEETSGDYEPEAHFDASSRRPVLPGLGCTTAQAKALRLSTIDRVDEEEEEWQAKYEADWNAKWFAPSAGVDGAVDAGGNGGGDGAGGGRGGGGGHTQGRSEYESSVDGSYFAGLSPEDFVYPLVANGGGGHAESSQHESDMERGMQDKRGAEEEESNHGDEEDEREDDEAEDEEDSVSTQEVTQEESEMGEDSAEEDKETDNTEVSHGNSEQTEEEAASVCNPSTMGFAEENSLSTRRKRNRTVVRMSSDVIEENESGRGGEEHEMETTTSVVEGSVIFIPGNCTAKQAILEKPIILAAVRRPFALPVHHASLITAQALIPTSRLVAVGPLGKSESRGQGNAELGANTGLPRKEPGSMPVYVPRQTEDEAASVCKQSSMGFDEEDLVPIRSWFI
jgi:hypothetical protein